MAQSTLLTLQSKKSKVMKMSDHLQIAREKLLDIRKRLKPNEFFMDDFGDLYEAVCRVVNYLSSNQKVTGESDE